MQSREGVAPSVIGADYMAEKNGEDPEIVYVPTQRVLRGDSEVTVELRRLPMRLVPRHNPRSHKKYGRTKSVLKPLMTHGSKRTARWEC